MQVSGYSSSALETWWRCLKKKSRRVWDSRVDSAITLGDNLLHKFLEHVQSSSHNTATISHSHEETKNPLKTSQEILETLSLLLFTNVIRVSKLQIITAKGRTRSFPCIYSNFSSASWARNCSRRHRCCIGSMAWPIKPHHFQYLI